MNDIRIAIEKEIQITKEAISELEEIMQPVEPDCAIGVISRIEAIQNQGVAEQSLKQAKDKLNKLEYMLNQIGTENFGKCKRCGKQIPIERILFIPENPFCINCTK